MELLKQPLYHPLSLHEKVITLCAATHKVMLGIEKAKIKQFQADLLRHFDSDYPEIGQEIEEKKVLTEELIEKIVETAKHTGARVSGPIPLPTDREIVTVLRATHKYKDSREQFESRTHKRLIDILKPSNKTVEALTSLQLPAGVDIEIML